MFTVAIPSLVLVRFKAPPFPAWLLIGIATAVGWLLPFFYMSLEQPWHRAMDLEQRIANHECLERPWVRNPNGSDSIDCVVGIGDWLAERYHPFASLLYGPIYLAFCWLAGWLLWRRSPGNRVGVLWLVAVIELLTGWIVILSPRVGSFSVSIDDDLWNPFFGPQLTLPVSLVTAWILMVWLPSAMGARIVKPHDTGRVP